MRNVAGLVFVLLVVLTWGCWRSQGPADAESAFDRHTTTTAYVFGVVPYLVHDEDGTHPDWRGLALGGVTTVALSLTLLSVLRKKPTTRGASHA